MNPFEKRATEYIREDLAFLPYVTPEPLLTYLERHAEKDVLFDRLAVLVGSPGSGKTTLARLFCLPTLTTMLRQSETWSSLVDAVRRCKAISNSGKPLIAGCRIPLESDYRGFWELPYEESIRQKLLYSLIQARAVLAWLRALEQAGHPLSSVKIVSKPEAEAALEAIGGGDAEKIRTAARAVERAVYHVTAVLIPPPLDRLPAEATSAYDPFDVIDAFEIEHGGQRLIVKPLVICDDAHVLHPKQFDGVVRWLARREISVARWVLTRIDALRPTAVLNPDESLTADKATGLNTTRDMVVIWMQAKEDRATNRKAFRRIARDMSERYLQLMPVFVRHRLRSLSDLLVTQPPTLAPGKLKQLQESLDSHRLRQVGPNRRAEIEQMVDDYLLRKKSEEGGAESPEIRAMMVRILLARYLNRVPQNSLFGDSVDVDPTMPLKADSGVWSAARMQLFHEYGLPFYYGFDVLSDAASENAERFLRLAGHLVAQLESQLIRDADIRLNPAIQEKLLRSRAERMLHEEDLPDRARVMKLCNTMADQCLVRTKEPNASLGEGPNAWGIRQSEFDSIPERHPILARVLQSGLAYNMFSLIRGHGTKGEIWCLLELSGTWSLAKGLTLRRGGFLEKRVKDLVDAVEPAESAS